MAGHLAGIHPGNAIIYMVTPTSVSLFIHYTVDEIGLIEEGSPHLKEIKTLFFDYLPSARPIYNTPYIDEWQLQGITESTGIFQEI